MKTISKIFLLLLFPVFFFIFIFSGCNLGKLNYAPLPLKSIYSETIDKSVPAAGINLLEVREINGSISISFSDSADIKITAEKIVRSSTPELAREYADKYVMTVEKNPQSGDLLVKTVYPRNTAHKCSGLINYNITAPEGTSLRLRTVNSSISVNPGAKAADAKTVNGTIHISSAQKKVNAKTTNGAINVKDSPGGASLQTVNGSIEYSLDTPPSGGLAMKTVNGAITVTVPENSSLDVEADTVNGKIECKMPMDKAEFKKHSLKGSLGTGTNGLRLSTVNGEISIVKSAGK